MGRKSISQTTPLEQAFTLAVAKLKEGEVVSYGDIAKRAGRPRAPRAAGTFLAQAAMSLPWWRVVRASGELASADVAHQAQLLRSEGVLIRSGRVVSAPHGRFAKGAKSP